jgi:hypothetical protein
VTDLLLDRVAAVAAELPEDDGLRVCPGRLRGRKFGA